MPISTELSSLLARNSQPWLALSEEQRFQQLDALLIPEWHFCFLNFFPLMQFSSFLSLTINNYLIAHPERFLSVYEPTIIENEVCIISKEPMTKEFGVLYKSIDEKKKSSFHTVGNSITLKAALVRDPRCPATRGKILWLVYLKDIEIPLLQQNDNNGLKKTFTTDEEKRIFPRNTRQTVKQMISATGSTSLKIPDIHFSPLYLVSTSIAKEYRFLTKFLQRNPRILESDAFKKALCVRLPSAAGEQLNISALYWLVLTASLDSNGSAQKILMDFLNQNSQIHNYLPFLEALCATIPSGTELLTNSSALLHLSKTNDGQGYLINILKQNPEFLKSAPFLEALCAIVPTRIIGLEKIDPKSNSSPLFYFSCTKPGYVFLLDIFEKNPEFLKTDEFVNALCAIQPIEAGISGSALYYLLIFDAKQRCLTKILEKNEKLLTSQKFLNALLAIHSEKRVQYANTSAIHLLMRSLEGFKIFLNILEKNPQIFKSDDFLNALCIVRTVQAVKYSNISALYWLIQFPEGLGILMNILEQNPEFIKSDALIKALCTMMTSEAGETANHSVLHILSNTSQGQNLLISLLDANPQLIRSLNFIRALCAVLPMHAGQYANTSALSCLEKTKEGRLFIQKCYEYLQSDSNQLSDELKAFHKILIEMRAKFQTAENTGSSSTSNKRPAAFFQPFDESDEKTKEKKLRETKRSRHTPENS